MRSKIKNSNKNADKQIVVLGGGFGGIRAALDLSKNKSWEIVLVSHNNYQDYHAALYEVATLPRVDGPAIKLRSTVALPISDMVSGRKNIVFRQAWVENIDLDRKLVRTDGGDLHYDALVIALGSQTDFFNIPGLAEHALTLKSFEDAIRVRNKVAAAINAYWQTRDESYLSFVIGGGGFTGVELAGELVNYLKHLVNKKTTIRPRVWVVEAASQLLPGLQPKASAAVLKRLESLGVNVLLNSFITKADDEGVTLKSGEKITARTLIWTGGVKSAVLPFMKKVACDKKGRAIVSRYLNLDVHPEVFIIGDCAFFADPIAGVPLPPTAQIAIQQAKYVAKVLPLILAKKPAPPFSPSNYHRYLIPLSGKFALFVKKDGFWQGFLPYLLRRLVDLRYFLSVLPPLKALAFWLKGSVIYLKND